MSAKLGFRRTALKRRKARSRRAIPGSVFTVQRPEVVYNQKMLNFFSRLHRSGKLSLAFPLSDSIARKHRAGGKGYWLVPFRKPSTPPVGSGLHERTLFARLDGREIAFKGSGAPFDEIQDLDDNGRYRVGRAITPAVRWRENEALAQRKLWGGADMPTVKKEAEIARKLHQAFNKMLRDKNPVLRMVAKKGVKRMPTLEPIAIFHPLQIPVEYRQGLPGGEKFIKRIPSKYKKAFDFVRKRNVSRKQSSEALHLKVPADEKLLEVEEDKLKNQALLVYSCKSQYRLMEAKKSITDKLFLAGKTGRFEPDDYEGALRKRSLESLHELFRVNGLKLGKREHSRAGSGKKVEIVPLELKNGKWRECSMRHAADKILSGFVTNLGTAVYVMHTGLRGSFSSIVSSIKGNEQIISSLSEQNLSLAGEPLDLDTARINIQNRELQGLLQDEDVKLAHNAIRKLARLVYPKTESVTKAEKAINWFEGIRLGKAKAKL